MLLLGAILNFVLAVGHLICLFFLDVAFKFYGIDGMMNEIASHGACLPYVITVVVAGCFALCGFYALSAAGKIRRLPLLWLGIFFVALFEFPAIKRLVAHGRAIPLVAIVLFALLCRDYAHFHVPYGRMLTGLAGCVIMLRLFSGISSAQTQAANMGGMVLRQFKRLGKSSMAIYVLSILLIPATPLFPDASTPQLAVFCGNLLLGLVI